MSPVAVNVFGDCAINIEVWLPAPSNKSEKTELYFMSPSRTQKTSNPVSPRKGSALLPPSVRLSESVRGPSQNLTMLLKKSSGRDLFRPEEKTTRLEALYTIADDHLGI
jgi:hypothetical protein